MLTWPEAGEPDLSVHVDLSFNEAWVDSRRNILLCSLHDPYVVSKERVQPQRYNASAFDGRSLACERERG